VIKTIKADLLIDRPRTSLYNAFKKVLQEWASYGVTTWSSSVEPLTTLPVFREMDRRGEMPIRFGFSHSVGLTAFPQAPQFYERLGDVEGMGSERFWPIGAGIYHADGNANPAATWTLCTTLEASPEVKSREMCELAGHHDVRRAALFNMVKYGNRITGTHAAGDAAVDQFMDVIEEASAAGGLSLEEIRARSHVIDHCALNPRPDQIERAKRLNIIWSCGPKYVDGGAQIARDYGEAYAHAWVAPIGSILRAGGRVAMEMDTPDVRKQGGVFFYVAKLLNRQDDRGVVWGPQEAIGREDALRMFTIWAAEYLKAENRLGSLEPGKLADLVVLDRDYFTVPLEEFPKIRTLLTLVGGEVAYRHPSLPLQ
jgi:predicted amidohydrolase YtcJ